ncbi:potassium-transporting ATPase subunit KdpA [Permianibacter sp. IMCC34836]|uniref:potassium-transporting ATPase subunit KdpA n=1 Tax=Permianibacter fluminis TaxID=2738515 RepID=UPI001556F277|nr:potassium-transporting ATPase subunit KdpA [Permianibacter fluminis]NQD37871.1 potassium-transporting ATPase subunit KdpA [Permianibacter fluminis]
MTGQGLAQIALYFGVLLLITKPLGVYITAIFDGRVRFLSLLERPLYKLAGVKDGEEMRWQHYALAVLIFNVLGVITVYALQRFQDTLPLNPAGFAAVSADSSFNTALSFVTNTNWQGYAGETTMSYLTQMLALTVQNFLSAATGIVMAIALIRGFARKSANTIGNAWIDLTRCTLYLLLPICVVFALVLVSQGVIQNFSDYLTVETLDGGKQTIAMGPVASQEAIKMLGTNGGGFFNANSAHPFENPTAFSNFLQMLSIFAIPAALCWVFGRMVGDTRQGWAILAAMMITFAGFLIVVTVAEQQGNPVLTALGADQTVSTLQSGGNMEGKEVRYGITNSALFATITTAASCGAVNAMHDSFTPIGGFVPMMLIQLGEVIFGGAGSGLYGMLMFAIIAVFIAGLMIGRTPEYIGKKIEAFDMKMVSVAILITPLLVLVGTAIAVVTDAGIASRANPGAHGFSEILYAFSSAANNNGSAFAGISANVPFYNLMLGITVWFGRFLPIVAVLAVAGNLASKKQVPAGAGTLPTHGPLFITLLIGSVLLVGALTFIPALALGPFVEQLMMLGR